MSVPDSEQLIKIAVILETTVSELLGTKVENEEKPDQLAKELSRINTQLAIRNHRTRRVLKIIAAALLVFAALIFAIMALNYAPMSQSKYTKRDAALLLPNRTDVISVSISCDDERETITDKREIDDLFANLSTVRIKSGESYSDSPTTDKFIKILFEVSDGLSGCVVYVFEDENGFFIEQPYNGIFSIEEKQYAEILGLLFLEIQSPMKSLAIILVCAGVVAALFANQIDNVARQNNVIKTILSIVVVLLALLVLLQILLNKA